MEGCSFPFAERFAFILLYTDRKLVEWTTASPTGRDAKITP